MFAEVVKKETGNGGRYYIVLFPEGTTETFLDETDAQYAAEKYNQEIEKELKIGGYKP